MKVVFLGTPVFAVPVLEAICASQHTVLAVVTQPDKPKGRKGVLTPPPAKLAAQALGLPVYQFAKIRAAESAEVLEQLGADVLVTAAYGQILSQRNLDAAPFGVVNAHASLLPAYRGAAPANWAIRNGEQVTGVTTMHTDIGVDTGDIIYQEQVAIADDDTAESLLLRLSQVAGPLMVKTLTDLEAGNAPRQKQDASSASYYPMLKKADGLLDFTQSAQHVANHARSVDPWPGAYAMLEGQPIKLFCPRPVQDTGMPGEILASREFVVACADHAVRFYEVQAAGKKRMKDTDFLRGKAIAPHTVLNR